MSDDEHRRHAQAFGGDMAAYARARPGYPDTVVDWLLPTSAVDVVDRARLLAAVAELARRWAAGTPSGLVDLDYVTVSWRGRRSHP